MPIGQLVVYRTDSCPAHPYNMKRDAKYMDQRQATLSATRKTRAAQRSDAVNTMKFDASRRTRRNGAVGHVLSGDERYALIAGKQILNDSTGDTNATSLIHSDHIEYEPEEDEGRRRGCRPKDALDEALASSARLSLSTRRTSRMPSGRRRTRSLPPPGNSAPPISLIYPYATSPPTWHHLMQR